MRNQTPGPLYLGLMSGTSADGIDAALVRFEPRLAVVSTRIFPYPGSVRTRILALARRSVSIALDDLGRLDAELGARLADAARILLAEAHIDAGAVAALGLHGQTVCHRPEGPFPFTLQLGDPNVIAERTGIVTVADFRRTDMAAGGQGAPLLPALHTALFSDRATPRAVLNLGGIANVTLLVPGRPESGFDTGPANCLLDAWSARHRGEPLDENGAWSRSGHVDGALLHALLGDPYFPAAPPKSTGREYFNLDWLDAHLSGKIEPADVQATLLQLSARSIADALRVQAPTVRELYACGGGVHNTALMEALRGELPDAKIATTAALGLDPDFVEAVGFAWLARARLEGLPGNLPDVTGARGPRVLGGVYSPFPRST